MSGAVMDTCKAHNMPSCGQCAQKLAFEAAVKEGDDDKAAELLKAGADISRTAGPTLRVALQKKMDKLAAGVLLSPHLKHDALTKQNLTFEKVRKRHARDVTRFSATPGFFRTPMSMYI
jgi:hypothetical protein